MDRRGFLRTLGGGLLVVLVAPRLPGADAESGGGGRATGVRDESQVAAWLHIGADGVVTVFTGKTEVGQNIRTSLTQAVAEELPVSLSAIRLVMADTDLVPYDAGTFGSRTTPQMNAQLRRVAATAREALLDLAAAHFKVERGELVADDGRIALKRDGGASVSFGELTQGTDLTRTIGADADVGRATQWTVAGKSVPKIDGRDFVTGRHRYASDIARPGMLHGRVLRPPTLGATLSTVDPNAAKEHDGVTVVRDGDFIGVAAPDALTAARALGEIRADWNSTPQISRQELFEHLRRTASMGGDRGDTNRGSLTDGLARAAHRLEATYTVDYIAHAPLEPRAAVAEWNEDRVTVWTGTQRPFGVRSEVARALGVNEDRVRVIVPDTGSGYGGKHTGEAAVEAARLARGAGRPVKIVWTREEEFTWAYARPAGVIDVRSGVAADGTITAWEFHNFNSGNAAIGLPYDCASQRIAFHRADSPLRQGSYRGLAATANTFARESQIDDLARAVGMDPVKFRLRNLSNDRLRAVIEAAAEKFGWDGAPPRDGRAIGFGCGSDKGSYLATAVEVEIDGTRRAVRVQRIVSAYECGAIVNPAHLLNQVEGGILQGLGGALFEALDFGDGRVRNARFSQYRVPRFRDVPSIETVLLDRRDLPSVGAGETPIIGIAPAIANAIVAATGQRLRALPLVPDGLPA